MKQWEKFLLPKEEAISETKDKFPPPKPMIPCHMVIERPAIVLTTPKNNVYGNLFSYGGSQGDSFFAQNTLG
jgi:hypothetical protein